MENRADQFLAAFSRIEKQLQKRIPEHRSFVSRVKEVARNDATVRRFQDDLIEYADLRNAIVHDRGGGHPIADPFPETVRSLQAIAELIVQPPQVGALAQGSVERCGPGDPIGQAARRMLEHKYSQLPVIEDGQCVDLLTTNTIARWISDRFSPDMNLLEEETVASVLDYREEYETHRFVPRTEPVAGVIELFVEVEKGGRILEAILITQNGRDTESPLGILTTFDLPRLYGALEA